MSTLKARSRACRELVGKVVKLRRPRRSNKYNAKPTLVDGIRFASQREGLRYVTLKQMERAGEIRALELQPKFDLLAWLPKPECSAFASVGKYVADFRYVVCATGKTVIEDCKGFKTDVYKLKRKIVESHYQIKITET